MRILKTMLVIIVLCLVGALSISCGSDADSEAVAEEQVVTVQRGDLMIDITAVGNLAFSHQEELAFEVGGTVGEILVDVGDSVEEGQVVAKLDDTSVASLQEAVSQAEINLEQAGINLENAEENLEEGQNPSDLDVAQAEAAVVNARVALEDAQEALEDAEKPYTETDIARAELAVLDAQIALDDAEDNLETSEDLYKRNHTAPGRAENYEQAQRQLALAEIDLAEAEEDLAEMMAGADSLEVEQKQKQLALVQASLEEAEDDLAEIQAWVEGDISSQEIEIKQLEIAVTQAALEIDTAQTALDEAIENLEGATMVAPFAGIVTSVDVDSGEVVNANQVIIELADPDRFETEILVGETDILNIQIGAEASIEVDSLSGISLPASVTFISPTATIQQGVVNYTVEVEIQSLQAMVQERQEAMPDISSGEIPEKMQEAIEQGLITQEQVDEMMKQIQAGDIPFPQKDKSLYTATPGNFQLKEGLTITVSIILEKRSDVLLVPNSAITSSGKQTYVQVLSPDGMIEERAVTTGISDWQYTEVTEGLSEGEQVVAPQGSTTTTQQDQSNAKFGPGMGGFGH